MTLDKIFFAYIVVASLVFAAILIAVPQAQNFWLKPYFWILLAVGLFDAGCYAYGKNAPGTMVGMPARLLGFVMGIVLMVAVTGMAGSQVKFF